MKNLNYEIEEKSDDLIIKFNVFTPDGKSKSIELNLEKKLFDNNHLIQYLLEEIKSIKQNMKYLEEKSEEERKILKEIFRSIKLK